MSFFCDSGSDYSLYWEAVPSEIVLSVKSGELSSICSLVIESFKLIPPTSDKLGLLALALIPDPTGIHLWAFGPRSGTFHFPNGKGLPVLAPGLYELQLDGQSCGLFRISEQGVEYPVLSGS